jgi:hypothetical protein
VILVKAIVCRSEKRPLQLTWSQQSKSTVHVTMFRKPIEGISNRKPLQEDSIPLTNGNAFKRKKYRNRTCAMKLRRLPSWPYVPGHIPSFGSLHEMKSSALTRAPEAQETAHHWPYVPGHIPSLGVSLNQTPTSWSPANQPS